MRFVRLPLAILAIIAIAACGSGKTSNAGSNGGSNAGSNAGSSMGSQGGQAAENMPNCGAVQPVWVNLRTKKYHEQGDPAYGHTRHGEYLCPDQARQQGFVAAGGGGAHRRHHRHHRYASGSGSQAGGYQSNDNQNDNSDATSNP